jgi:hypothetical protein
MRSTRAGSRLAALFLCGLVTALPAAAQPADGGDPAGAKGVSEQEMAAFARASRAVRALSKGETEPVGAEVRARMVEAVKAEGLAVARYNTIARRVRQQQDLYARYQQAWNAHAAD